MTIASCQRSQTMSLKLHVEAVLLNYDKRQNKSSMEVLNTAATEYRRRQDIMSSIIKSNNEMQTRFVKVYTRGCVQEQHT